MVWKFREWGASSSVILVTLTIDLNPSSITNGLRPASVVRRGKCQLQSRLRHLTMVQNYEARRQRPSCS
ncbi:hypothetical protein TNCV_3022361 [Trichonephila clavipes]|nr:hypothetical protein TNCV_3022361 [Trichonephila clavipes]